MRPLVPLFLVLLFACNGQSPTSPANGGLAGEWTGSLGEQHPSGEDWTSVVIRIDQNGAALSGELRERNGRVHPVSGSVFSDTSASLNVTDIMSLGQNGCSSVSLLISRVERNALSGSMQGKCYGTMLGTFRLVRR